MTNARTAILLTPDSGTRSGNETAARILAVAEKLFAEHGIEGTSLNDIAERAGVSKANIFHHFSSKRELYLAVLRNACACKAADQLEQQTETDGPFAEHFAIYAKHSLQEMLAQERLHRLVMHELLADTGKVAQELAESVFKDKFGQLVTLLRAGQARGELRADFDPAMAVVTLVGANILFLHFRNVLKHFPDVTFADDVERHAKFLSDVLLRGMLPPSASAPAVKHKVRKKKSR